MGALRSFVTRSRPRWFAIACALGLSIVAVRSAPQSVFPTIQLARVEIFADADGLDSEAVRAKVALPLEAALATVPRILSTRSYARPGKLELELDFDPATRPVDDRRAVEAVVSELRDRLPVTHVTTVVEGPEEEPVVTYAFTSRSINQGELANRIRDALPATFAATPQLGRTTLFAGPDMIYDVSVTAKELARDGLSTGVIANAIERANGPRIAGVITRADERMAITTGTTPADAASIGAIGIDTRGGRVVPLRSIARIAYVAAPTGAQASFDATHAVLLNAYSIAGGDALVLARNVAARVTRLRSRLPADTQTTIAWDQTRLIADSQRTLRFEMIAGGAVALLVIAWFLRDLALTLAAAIVLPIALAITVAILVAFGESLNVMTLGGLAIAIGLIVDEAIVVLEAIARGPTIAAAVRRVAQPLIASTTANVVVFLPLALLGGVAGYFFRALALTLCVALIVSIALSLAIAPLLVSVLNAIRKRARPVDRVERIYTTVIRQAIKRPVLVLSIATILSAAAIALFARMPTDFLPAIDEGAFEITYAMPPGTSLAAADTLATSFERAILREPGVAHVSRLSGVDTNGYIATPPDAGTLRVLLAPDRKSVPFDQTADRMRAAIGNLNPYVAVEIHQLLEDQINDLSGAPEPIQLLVRGPDQRTLVKIAGTLADLIATVPGVVDTFDGVTWEPRSARAEPLDARVPSSAAFADALGARLSGTVAMRSVRVRIADGTAAIARIGPPALASTVETENGERVVRVTAQIESGDLSTIMATIDQRIAPVRSTLPPGYAVETGGASRAQHTAFVAFATIFGLALVLLCGVLICTFDSVRLSLVALSALPAMPLGVVVALTWTKTSLNVSSFMGMLLLCGIVVRTSILLIESAGRRRREGASVADAIEGAGRERLRPVLMTTLAALGAIAPLAFGVGSGSEFERPLAIAVMGGIVTATALTLLVVPVLYVVTATFGQPTKLSLD